SAVPVTKQIPGLSPNTTYHFRIVGQNSVGTSNGSDLTCTTPPPAVNPCTSIAIDRSTSNNVIDVTFTGSCDAVMSISNKKNYWTHFRLTSTGSANIAPIGGDINVYALLGLLPPIGNVPLPGADVSFMIRLTNIGDKITITTDDTDSTRKLNGLQAILNLLPRVGGLPALVIDNHQKVTEAFARMPHLQNALNAMFTPCLADLFSCATNSITTIKELGLFLSDSNEVLVLATLRRDLYLGLGLVILENGDVHKYLKPWALLNSVIAIIGNIRGAVFQIPSGTVTITAQ
ncbi:MAG TPA: fibronectin type III domain-containing protein, partial [Pyrinomonadaceae bacterium]|nr:fibronectin type III domain-containing protein [Pyrinomonadaceae bacterium]